MYVVGGTVRDILLGRVPKDYDILTSADPGQVGAALRCALHAGLCMLGWAGTGWDGIVA